MESLSRTTRSRWKLALAVLPAVAAVALAKTLITELDAESIELNPLYTGLVAGNIFLLGFLLAGTLADYKESEKLPVELAASLDSIADELRIIEAGPDGHGAGRAALEHVSNLVQTVLGWFYGREQFDTVLDRVQGLNEHFRAVEPYTQATYVNRIKGEQSASRRMLLRIQSIHETQFVVAGFMVAALTSTLLIAVLLFIDVGDLATDLILLCTLTFLLGYVLLLIRDLDDPFAYTAEGEKAGSVEASLEPLVRLGERLPRPGG
jgi:hypothetical protein